MKLPPSTEETDGPNLTPVIDVVFLLLIFFLVATTYAQMERELPVNLPEVTQAQPYTMTKDLIINITEDGRFIVAQQEYDERQLLAIIGESRTNNPTQKALIRGDGDTALKYAARVMGLCNEAGMEYRLAAVLEPN